ncbi:hypothetical protein EN858_23810 [Mesorhizobium sp. M4B.F.Ca.ET.215.01.1.1]|uniref:DUF6165 family protein n=1 Tax=unclassified Mesorhizobium TaxID=325217 RepID=UPI000FC9E737|nr:MULTISPECIES: DUF6165 family protein [unclassified Mesorhizobium]RUW21647.1 hypothetical protein EOA34_23750 [Mesorhizobium sp. M4B.F.Ca.ET.013.02.1.1]RVD45604.1 hypothetical protein EN741_04690 [Mesorhizobium sp. M4B.F.Ca.ET.019.03.1.1]RWF65894.1 MAG: hypothetical protein EOS47_08460 [Mesorhizobium sp.]TGQ08255.1 hypothetical protein EN858_23810 [Mesorhizobium sp. M4B.F.Ca.ET.215.01.1.1]TGQ32828.1 hypothetical protein EN857_22675 [Mesorhizobium sp. M4B.F.Ca.ET.214.01.1.1]
MVRPIRVEIAPGELLDKISILEIKAASIADASKLANVQHELEELSRVRDDHLPASETLAGLYAELKAVNQALWVIEDDIRVEELNKRFGDRFIELARGVYRTNDRRAALKREINVLLSSSLIEEKSYENYE